MTLPPLKVKTPMGASDPLAPQIQINVSFVLLGVTGIYERCIRCKYARVGVICIHGG